MTEYKQYFINNRKILRWKMPPTEDNLTSFQRSILLSMIPFTLLADTAVCTIWQTNRMHLLAK